MNSYNELITLIDAVINRNGVQAITGMVLNGVLKAMVQQLGAGYSLSGVAHPTDDPGTPERPVCYYASEVGTYTNFGGVGIVAGELALLCYDMTDGWFKETMYEGFRQVTAQADDNIGVPSVGVSYSNGVLEFLFRNIKGEPGENGQDGQDGQDGAAAGFGTITASVDANVGTPSVAVTESGPDTAKNLAFAFHNLKGADGDPGVTSVNVTVDNTSGSPACAVSLNAGVLTLAFTGLKGAQGDTGSSVAYPFTIVNNLTTDDATQALSAAQGVVLEGEISQLEAEVDELSDEFTVQAEITGLRNGYISTNGNYDPGVYGLSGCKCADISVQPGQVYNIYGTGANHNYYRLYAVFASDGTRLDRDTTSGDYTQTPRVVTIPDGGVHLVVNLYQYNATTDKILRVGDRYNAAKLESEFFEIYKGLDKVLKLNDKVIANNELNLLDASKYVNGYINPANGTVTSNDSYRTTDYILLSAGVKYFFGRLHNTQFAFYDLEKSFLSDTGYYHYSNYGQGYILTDRDCYFRATAISVTSSPQAYVSAIIDGYMPYGDKGFYEGEYAKWIKTPNGTLSPNLFNGLCEYGEVTTLGELKDGITAVRTMPIYCTGTIYIKLFGGKAGDLQYIYEYDADGVFVKYDMVYTTEAKVTLDGTTKSIRIVSTIASQIYTPPTPDFVRTHLFVTNDADVFGKWLPKGYTIAAKDVDDHFFDTASTFELDYIKNALDSHIATIKHTGYDAVIPCMTDIHLDDAEPYKMLNYLAASGVADICFNLGDTIRENYPTKAETEKVLENAFHWSNSMPRKSPLLSLRGNHDTNPVSDASAMISTREFAALAENRTMPGYASNIVNYGYLDLPSKIRLVWLDTSDIFDDNDDPIVFGNYTLIRQGQLDWLCNEALNFKDKTVPGDWSAILLSHDGVSELSLTAIIEAFVAGSSASGTINYARKAVDMQTDVTVSLHYNVNFTEQGPVDMLCCVCGHYHKDKIADIGTSGVKQVYIACDNVVAHYDDDGTDETYDRTYGTIEEHICDTICVDKATRTVLFKRLGVGSDRSITY